MADPRPLLDRPIARVVALLLFAGMVAALLLPDWDGLFTYGSGPPANPDLTRCLDKRLGDVRQMQADGTITDAQASQFRERAQNYCHSRFGG
ncbi:hypothetical protein [Rhodovibrio salinarum]|uniref:Uncharacterized protein n=1 Tax=Rhodovibrio salinarum TaxID=1087 RepID=A0A934QLY7_9PROT|nr:hypothetical protein [Rhodovibrio salinarum]MBK1699276.1 hypothetical protein [Rhodovibrio salinarum]